MPEKTRCPQGPGAYGDAAADECNQGDANDDEGPVVCLAVRGKRTYPTTTVSSTPFDERQV